MAAVAQPEIIEPYLKPYGPKAYEFAFRHPSQDKKITLLEGSVRSAKTWALHPKVISLCAYPVKGLRLFTGVTKSSIKNNVLNDLFEIVGRSNYSYNSQSGEIDLFGVPWLAVGAKDEGSEKIIRGSTVGICVGDEWTLQAVSFWKMVLNRMSVEGARCYGTTNPDTPFHPVYTDIVENKLLQQRGDLEVIHFEISDNPNLPDWYETYLDSIYPPGSLYHQRFVKGLWVTGEGAIFKDCWSEELLYQDEPWTMKNGKPGMVTPERLREARKSATDPFIAERAVSVDCGVDHVQVYLDSIDDGQHIWFDREYWWDSRVTQRQKTDRQYREDLQTFMGDTFAKVILPPECASFDAELTQAGIWHTDADNDVLDGIKMVSSMMALKKIHFRRPPEDYIYDGGSPYHDHCGETIKQVQTYVWDPKASKLGVEKPLKTKDDGTDAVRYKIKTDVPAWRLAA